MSRNVKDAIASALQMWIYGVLLLNPVWMHIFPDALSDVPDFSAIPDWEIRLIYWLLPVLFSLLSFVFFWAVGILCNRLKRSASNFPENKSCSDCK